MDLDKLHEEEIALLGSPRRRPMQELRRELRSNGFALYDDVWSLDRTDAVPAWQHGSIVEIDILKDGHEVYDDDVEWDAVRLRYLFASLPRDFIAEFIDVVRKLSRSLSLAVTVNRKSIDEDELTEYFEQCAEELLDEFGEYPGSESLAIFIQSTYPRRKN